MHGCIVQAAWRACADRVRVDCEQCWQRGVGVVQIGYRHGDGVVVFVVVCALVLLYCVVLFVCLWVGVGV